MNWVDGLEFWYPKQMVEVYFSEFEMTDRPVAGVLQMRRVETF